MIGLQGDTAGLGHKVWLAVHARLLKAHVNTRTMLHKLMPRLLKEPSLRHMLRGQIPYRKVVHMMCVDGILLAGLVLVVGHYTTAASLNLLGIKLH